MIGRRLASGVVGIALLLIFWELGAILIGQQSPNPDIVWPHLSKIVGEGLPGISTVDTTGAGQKTGENQASVLGAIEVLVVQAWVTIRRVALGATVGLILGCGLGAMINSSRLFNAMFSPVLNALRQIPLFSLTLLFLIWFGGSDLGITVFVIYGTSLVMMVATAEAIENVPEVHVQYAQALGASRTQILRTVIGPAVIPPLAAVTLVVTGLAWAMVLAAELLGTQHGLGRLILFFQLFNLTDRMTVVAFTLTLLAIVSHFVLAAMFTRLTRWVPRKVE